MFLLTYLATIYLDSLDLITPISGWSILQQQQNGGGIFK